jgi:hypothetical protein
MVLTGILCWVCRVSQVVFWGFPNLDCSRFMVATSVLLLYHSLL